MGQIKNIKLHIVTDIKGVRMAFYIQSIHVHPLLYRTSNILVRARPNVLACTLVQQQLQLRHKGVYTRQRATKRLKNPWTKRRTDFIKLLCISLIRYERILTTLNGAKRLEQYGNLLIEMTRRTRAPPDITVCLDDGFLLRPDEVEERFMTRKLINRKWKKRLVYPDALSEEEYVERCRVEAGKILLQDGDAMDKLFDELRERYRNRYGGYVKITPVPVRKYKQYPPLAYVELQDNRLPPLPQLPVLEGGELAMPRFVGGVEHLPIVSS